MPNKDEGDDKKSTKDVVNKKQKQMMNQEDYLPEEGYDVARDQGRVKPSKDKKDATSYPPSDEVKKTQKKNKGSSALERVKADIEKKYGKGAIMKTKKEELDLTKVAEAFGATIVEVTRITGDNYKKITTNLKKKNPPIGDIRNPDSAYDYNQLTGKEKEEYQKIKNQSSSSKNPIKKRTITTSGGKTVTDVKKRNLFPKAGSANTPAVKKVKSGITKRLATQTKTAQKKIIKTVAKKAATRGIGKTALKFGAKRVPGLGAIISGAEAVGKLATGDLVGAGLAAGEGILSSIPGVGTVASTALGGYSAVRDARRAAKAASTIRKVVKSTKGAKGAVAVKKAFKASPKITKKLAPTSKKGFKGFMGKVKDPKTRIGKAARIGGGIGLDVVTPGGVTKNIVRGLVGGAKKSVDGGHVGRRTAG